MSQENSGAATRRPNRLAQETSPYLLQHAHNPVDWFPWGDEAFARARAADKPVFLSVGYSACHWCHVMERESFENEAIAEILNANFVSIKVDREERPDVDQIYMTAVQAMTQRGGWPMSVFMTPDQQPFFGGTYWPPTDRMAQRGFDGILQLIADYWRTRRTEVLSSAASLTEAVNRMAIPEFEPAELSPETLRSALRSLLNSADLREGGFGGAPKFPHPMDLRVLLRAARRFQLPEPLDVVRLTLDKMAAGGIYDHLGGGFHRYSTDARWLVPHFEKMLYDNALLVPVYLEFFQIEGRESDARVARETLDYVLREMTSPEGGFYSTQDADSEGVEGQFFVWTAAEVVALLGPDEARLFCYAYDVTPGGNWEGQNILHRPKTSEQVARLLGLTVAELEPRLAAARQVLFEARSRRIPPARDDKVLTAWNGLMLSALARGGLVLHERRYADAAARAAEFLLDRMRASDGRLWRSWQAGIARIAAYLDDYACLISGLIDLYQSAFEPRWLEAARDLADVMIANFGDPDGGFYYTAVDHERLIARTRDVQDNATPSGTGMAAYALLRLGRLTSRPDFEDCAQRALSSISGLLVEHPRAAGQSLMALDDLVGPSHDVVIVDAVDHAGGDELVRAAARPFSPNVLVTRAANSAFSPLVAQLVAGRELLSGRATAFVCERGACQSPTNDPADLERRLRAPVNAPR